MYILGPAAVSKEPRAFQHNHTYPMVAQPIDRNDSLIYNGVHTKLNKNTAILGGWSTCQPNIGPASHYIGVLASAIGIHIKKMLWMLTS